MIARLDAFRDDDTIYVEAPEPSARAVVTTEPDDGSVPPEADGLVYFLEVHLAKEAIDVWRRWRGDKTPEVDDKVAAVIYYAQNDDWLPVA